jgi:hypothetical protein
MTFKNTELSVYHTNNYNEPIYLKHGDLPQLNPVITAGFLSFLALDSISDIFSYQNNP